MMNKLTIINKCGTLLADSREVAEMVDKEHYDLLKEIEGRADGKNVGIIPTLLKGNFPLSNYFIESTYKDSSGKSNKCYLITKMGCELIGNKQQGEKGILFTAEYVTRFNEMELQLQWSNPSYVICDPIERAKRWIEEQEEIRELELLNKSMKPKVEYFDALVDRKTNINFRDTAKELGIKQNTFINWLIANGYIYRTNGKRKQLKPHAGYEDLFVLLEWRNRKASGNQTLLTVKGRDTFRMLADIIRNTCC